MSESKHQDEGKNNLRSLTPTAAAGNGHEDDLGFADEMSAVRDAVAGLSDGNPAKRRILESLGSTPQQGASKGKATYVQAPAPSTMSDDGSFLHVDSLVKELRGKHLSRFLVWTIYFLPRVRWIWFDEEPDKFQQASAGFRVASSTIDVNL